MVIRAAVTRFDFKAIWPPTKGGVIPVGIYFAFLAGFVYHNTRRSARINTRLLQPEIAACLL